MIPKANSRRLKRILSYIQSVLRKFKIYFPLLPREVTNLKENLEFVHYKSYKMVKFTNFSSFL